MKRVLLISLLVVNAGLLTALVLMGTETVAWGQAFQTDYVMVSGKIGQDWDGVYVLDLASRKLVAMKIRRQQTPYRMELLGGRDVAKDARAGAGGTTTPPPKTGGGRY